MSKAKTLIVLFGKYPQKVYQSYGRNPTLTITNNCPSVVPGIINVLQNHNGPFSFHVNEEFFNMPWLITKHEKFDTVKKNHEGNTYTIHNHTFVNT